jgi:hypothetical protein
VNDSHERRFAYEGGALAPVIYALLSVLILGLLAAAYFSDGALRYVLLAPMFLCCVLLWAGHRVSTLDRDGERAVLLGPDELVVPKPMSRSGVHRIPLSSITSVEWAKNGDIQVAWSGRTIRVPSGLVADDSLKVLHRELQRRVLTDAS